MSELGICPSQGLSKGLFQCQRKGCKKEKRLAVLSLSQKKAEKDKVQPQVCRHAGQTNYVTLQNQKGQKPGHAAPFLHSTLKAAWCMQKLCCCLPFHKAFLVAKQKPCHKAFLIAKQKPFYKACLAYRIP